MKNARPLLFLTLCLAAAPLFAVTYKWTDENGTVVYSQNRPPAGTPYETIETPRSRPAAPAPAKPRPSFLEQVEKDKRARAKEATVRETEQAALEMRRKNCEAARNNLQVYTAHRRIKQEDGSVIRLDDNERLRKIEEARQAIKEFCD